MPKGYVYILECADGSYYTGSTKNLELRLEQHQNGEGANHTHKHLPVKLVYFEEFARIDEAFYREKQIQGWSRKKKEALINNNVDKLHNLAECKNETHSRNVASTPLSHHGTERCLSEEKRCLSGAEGKSGYKKTKIGWIPEEWKIASLGDKGKIINGLTYSPNDVVEEGLLVLRSSNVQNGLIEFEDNVFVKADGLKYNPVEEDDILICVRNGSKSLIGKNALIGEKCTGMAFGAFMAIYRSDFNKYFIHLFKTDIYQREVHRNLGATINSINGSDLRKFSFPLPPLPEQQKIAQILSTWDKAIEQTQNLIEQLNTRRRGLMQQLLSGKTRLKEFSEVWKEYSIDELFKNTTRYVKWNEEESYSLVSIRRRYGGLFFRGDLLGQNISVKKLKSIHRGDFLISKRQVSHGAWAIVKDEFHNGKVSDEYICLEISNDRILSSEFWNYFIQQKHLTYYAFLDSIGVHIEKLIFHYKWFEKRKVHIPTSLVEQQAIAKVLTTADNEIKTQETYLQQLQDQKKGLMQQLLTGQKRVITK